MSPSPPRAYAAHPTGYATPRVAALDYSKDTTAARRDLLAKYKFVILSFSKTMGGTKLQEVASDAEGAKNPNLPIAQYTLANEAKCDPNDTVPGHVCSDHRGQEEQLVAAQRRTGERVQWTTAY